MKRQIEIWSASILVRIQFAAAGLDAHVLQWPGGGLLAPFLWLYGMSSVHRRGSFARLRL